FYIGNNTSLDGWKIDALPLPAAGERSGLLAKDAMDDPLRFASFEVEKLARLWLASWNPLQSDLLVLSPGTQEVLHELILFLAIVGLALFVGGHGRLLRKSVRTEPVLVLVAVLAAHCLYLVVDPCARNAFTAMPAIALLAASSGVMLRLKSG